MMFRNRIRDRLVRCSSAVAAAVRGVAGSGGSTVRVRRATLAVGRRALAVVLIAACASSIHAQSDTKPPAGDAGTPPGASPQQSDAEKAAARKTEEVKRILEATGGSAPAEGGAKSPQLLPTVDLERKSNPEAVAIVEKYLQAIGGREVLTGINDRVTKFRNTKFSATGETVAVIALYLKRGYLFREEWEIKGFNIGDKPLAFYQVYNGKEEDGWVSMFNTVSPLEGRTLSVFVWDKYLDDFFMNWESDGFIVDLDGQGIVEKDPCTIVRVTDFTGRNAVRYFFANGSGLLVKKEWTDVTSREPAKKEQYFRDYKRIAFSDGSGRSVQFALKVEILTDGDLDTERDYVEVKFNSNISDELFAKPAGVPFEQRDRLGAGANVSPDALQKVLQDAGAGGSGSDAASGGAGSAGDGASGASRAGSGAKTTEKKP